MLSHADLTAQPKLALLKQSRQERFIILHRLIIMFRMNLLILVAMRDYCNKTLLQMRDNGEVNKKRQN